MTIPCENNNILFNKAVSLRSQGLLVEAEDLLRKLLDADPRYLPALVELGNTLYSRGLMNDAAHHFQVVIEINPDLAVVHNNLGIIFQEQGLTDRAIAAYRRAIELDPSYNMAHSNLLRCLNFHPGMDNEHLFQAHQSFETLHGTCRRRDSSFSFAGRNPEKRLRIGYVSPDLGAHSVAYFVTALFPNHDRNRFEVYCYSDRNREDSTTERIKEGVDVWRKTSGMDDESLFKLIRNDSIDILVDLAGHTGGNRLTVFAMKPAPIQVTWLGYPNTTGLTAMDYRIVDEVTDPPGEADRYHTETLVRLPNGFLCFDPPDNSPAVTPLPMLRNGFVTFGCFNALAKITDEAIELWSRILNRVPGSRILLKNKCLFDESTREGLMARFSVRGISGERVMMTPYTLTTQEHLSCYRHLDISLDTFPYNGTTTTCESLWMGVPVIGPMGNRHAARVTASVLLRLGLDGLVARNVDECVDLAVNLAGRSDLLEMLRGGIRERMRTSRLCDGNGFAEEMQRAYLAVWNSFSFIYSRYICSENNTGSAL